jgi:hypoxanthine phosphoribosyltransferase
MRSPVTVNNTSYLAPSWQEMGELVFNLAKQIIDSKTPIDQVIALATGGLEWSKTLTDYLGIKQISSIRIQFYQDIYKTNNTPVITQSLPVSIVGQHVLIFDDVVDSGKSLDLAKKYLEQHGPASIHTGVLFKKSWSKFNPDFYAFESDSWLIFPHDTREMIKLLCQKIDGSKEIQIKTLIEIGIPKDQAEFFVNQIKK